MSEPIEIIYDEKGNPLKGSNGWPMTYTYDGAREHYLKNFLGAVGGNVKYDILVPKKSPNLFRTVIFGEDGMIANYKQLMDGVPFVKQTTDKCGKDCRTWGTYDWKREAVVFVSKDDAMRVLSDKKNSYGDSRPEGYWWGHMYLREYLHYAPQLPRDRPAVYLHYEFYIHPNSQRFDKERSFSGSIREDLRDFVAEAMDTRSE